MYPPEKSDPIVLTDYNLPVLNVSYVALSGEHGGFVPVLVNSIGERVGVPGFPLVPQASASVKEKAIKAAKIFPSAKPLYERGIVKIESAVGVGYGVRLGPFLVSCAHVLGSCERKLTLTGRNGFTKVLSPTVISNETKSDLAFVVLSFPDWAHLGARSQSISNVRRESACVIYAPGSNNTIEIRGTVLSRDKLAMVRHDCSTQSGYSGLPVFSGGKVVMIHSSASSENYNLATALFPFQSMGFLGGKVKETGWSDSFEFSYIDALEDRAEKLAEAYEALREAKEGNREGFDNDYEFVTRDEIEYLIHNGDIYLTGDIDSANWAEQADVADELAKQGYRYGGSSSLRVLESLETYGDIKFHDVPYNSDYLSYGSYVIVGTCEDNSHKISRKFRAIPSEVLEIIPELKDYSWPPMNEKSLEAAAAQSLMGQRVEVPKSAMKRAKKRLRALFGNVNVKVNLFSNFDQLFKEAYDSLKGDSSPGYPFNTRYHSNAEVCKAYGFDELKRLTFQRLHKIAATDLSKIRSMFTDDPESYLQLIDPCYVFKKWEPHPSRKLVPIDRSRIIWGTSLIDQLVARVATGRLSKYLVALYPSLPSTLGIGFTDDMVEHFAKDVIKCANGNPVGVSDVSKWDGTVSEKSLIDVFHFMSTLIDSDMNLKSILEKLAVLIAHSYFVMNGKLCRQVTPGVIASGRYETSTANTLLRLLLSYSVSCVTGAKAQGDDCMDFGTDFDQVLETYKSYGLTVRDVAVMDPLKDGFSFCSHHFFKSHDGRWRASLESWPKSLYKLLSTATQPEQYQAFIYETRWCSADVKSRIELIKQYVTLPGVDGFGDPQINRSKVKQPRIITKQLLYHTMPTKKKNNNKGRNATLLQTAYGVPSQRGNTRINKGPSNELITAVCSNLDPFCPHAEGAKLYDRDSSKTFAIQVKSYQGLNTDANGKGAMEVNASLNDSFTTASTITGDAVTAWNAYSTADGYSSIDATFNKYRIVSWGVRVYCSAKATESQGTLILATASDSGISFNVASSSYEEVMRFPLYGADVYWISKAQSYTATKFEAIATAVSNDWNHLYIGLDNCQASSNVLGIEIVYNLELQVDPLDFFSRATTPAWPDNVLVQQAVAMVASDKDSAESGNLSQISSRLRQKATKALKSLMVSSAASYGGPVAGSAMGLLMDRV